MNGQDTSRFDELISRYLDGELSQDERSELLQSLTAPETAERFLELTKLNAEMSGLLSAPVPDSVMVQLVMSDLPKSATNVEEPLRLRLQPLESARSTAPIEFVPSAPALKRRPRFQFGALKWAAALVALVAVAAIFSFQFWRTSDSVKVTRIEGEVYFIGDSGEKRLQANNTVGVGKVKTVGASSRATIALGDGTRVDVGENTLLAIRPAKDKARFFLESGALESKIAKQPKDRPLVFATPEAEATVKGTVLALTTWSHHTRLDVTEGEVLLKRQQDGAQVLVHGGYHVLVAPDVKLVASPNNPVPAHR